LCRRPHRDACPAAGGQASLWEKIKDTRPDGQESNAIGITINGQRWLTKNLMICMQVYGIGPGSSPTNDPFTIKQPEPGPQP